MAENHRHRDFSSASVNSYLHGPEDGVSGCDEFARAVSGKGTTFIRSDTLPPIVRPHNSRHFAYICILPGADDRSRLPTAAVSQRERRALADYLSILDRYNTLVRLDPCNTIPCGPGVNRAQSRAAAFRPAVPNRQQLQNGNRL